MSGTTWKVGDRVAVRGMLLGAGRVVEPLWADMVTVALDVCHSCRTVACRGHVVRELLGDEP